LGAGVAAESARNLGFARVDRSAVEPGALPNGLAVFIDDSETLVRWEWEIAIEEGFETILIDNAVDLKQKITEIFSDALSRGLSPRNIVFFVDNHMRSFAKVLNDLKHQNVVYFEPYRKGMGPNGNQAGMAIAEWMVEFADTYPGFFLAVLSVYPHSGISRRLTKLADQYPQFLGFLNKITVDPEGSSPDQINADRFREALSKVKMQDEGLSVGRALPADYPYEKVLLELHQDLEFSDDDLRSFLRLSESAIPKLQILKGDPANFELDTLDWKEKTYVAFEIIQILQHDFGDIKRVQAWFRAPHGLLGGKSPRELVTSGSLSQIDMLWAIVRF
jgi:hypothetical protein